MVSWEARGIVGLYKQVIAKDASFAPTYAGLAAAYAAGSFQGFHDHTDDLLQMRAAAEKVIGLDPLLAEAHQALGMVYARDGQWTQSEKSFRRAIELDPSDSLAYSDLTINLLLPLGRIEDGIREMRIAEKTDPLSPWVQNILGWALLSAGRYEEAAGHCRKAGTEATECLGGRDWPRAELTRQSRHSPRSRIPAISVTPTGAPAAARRPRNWPPPLRQTRSHRRSFLPAWGTRHRTFEALDRVAELGAVRIGRALNSQEFALLRGDHRAKALRKRVGLPE